MKLAIDPQMYFGSHTVYELPDIVARLGYDWMELSPKGDFVPFFRHPRVDDAEVAKLKKVAADAGVGIASLLPVQRWSGPGEDERQAAVRSFKRIIQIAVDLGVDVINTEFNGRPEQPERAEAMFLRSMDELAPIFETEGVSLIIEPHPDDFIEDGLDAIGLIRGLNADWLGMPVETQQADTVRQLVRPSAARTVLSSVAGSLVTVTSLTFSRTVITLQLASSQFSPRLLRTFTQDIFVQITLTNFLATVNFSLTVLRSVRSAQDSPRPFVPRLR